ncbi:MAG: hypothetical protein ACE5PV_01940 [Candidatus Poribacteria bacterium]
MQELEADSLFQVLIKLFYAVFGIEDLSQIKTELKEILAESVRIDAVVTFPDDFDFTKLKKRIFPWLGKHNVFEYKGEFDWLKVGQYFQYAFVELGLILTQCLSKERKDRTGREWLSQKGIREYWNKLKNQGAKHLCATTILSTGDPRGIRNGGGFQPVTQYIHLRGALYRKVIYRDEFIGTIAVYLVVLNKLKVCAINAPLLLLSTGEKLKEFCQWLVTETEELTIEEQVAYRTLIITYNILKDEEMKKQMGRKVWKPDYDQLAEYLHEGMPPEIREKFIQSLLRVDSPEEAVLKLIKTKEQQKRLLEFLQRNLDDGGN